MQENLDDLYKKEKEIILKNKLLVELEEKVSNLVTRVYDLENKKNIENNYWSIFKLWCWIFLYTVVFWLIIALLFFSGTNFN